MRRREFLSVLSSAVSWPIVVHAQTPKLRTIGFLGTDATNWAAWTAAFVARMRELGWIERSTIAIEYRWSEGRSERVVEVAAEFVRLKVDVIVSYGTAIPSLMQATSTIPIVFAIAIDPVGAGLVASLGRPGGNVTGVSSQQTDIAGKRLDLLHEVVPDLRHLVIMANVANSQAALEMGEVQAAARSRPRNYATHHPPVGGYRDRLCRNQVEGGCTLRCSRRTCCCQSHTNNNLRAQQRATDDH